MEQATQFISATPVLASLDIVRSVEFFSVQFGFSKIHVEQGVYGVVTNGSVQVHFWACSDKTIAEQTSCRIRVSGIEDLYHRCEAAKIVHPNGKLEQKPWGSREFAVLDPDGNLVTFNEWNEA